MGQRLSRALGSGRAGPEEDPGGGAGGYRYPPKGGGNFFASHFIMGGEKFDSPQPESFLFGDNADLNFLGGRPVSFPYPPPQANEPTKTLRSLMNIRRDSVHFVAAAPAPEGSDDRESDEEERRYNLEFTFDSDVRCAVTIYYFCYEEVHAHGVTYNPKLADLVSETYTYGRGAAQVFRQPTHFFVPTARVQDLLDPYGDPGLVPLAIQCVSLEGDTPRQSHSTLGLIDRYSDSSYVVKGLKQKLFVDGLCYLLQEIYGLENKVSDTRHQSLADDEVDDSGAECVVCMCDLRDTIILPCRHLCLCNACADSLRYQANNCPICRVPFRALLQVRAVQKVGQVTHPALADAADIAQEGVPAGYQCVSLVEALNGPMSVAPPQPPQPVQSHEKRSRKNRSGKKRSSRSAEKRERASAAANAAAATGQTPEVDDVSAGASTSGAASAGRVTLRIVNELEEDNSIPSTERTSVVRARTSVDVVDEELAQMAVAESLNDVATEEQKRDETSSLKDDTKDEEEDEAAAGEEDEQEDEEEEEEEEEESDETVVVNLTARSSRISIPGTPTSVVSARSSQDSSSSSSSTKQLLSGQQQPQQQQQQQQQQRHPLSVGSAVIVRVHPPSSAGDDERSKENTSDET